MSRRPQHREGDSPGDAGDWAMAGVMVACALAAIIIIPFVVPMGSMPMAPPMFEHQGYVGVPFKRHCDCAPDPPYGTSYEGDLDANSTTNPRRISNEIFHQDESIPSEALSAMWWLMGQFIDHELTETRQTEEVLTVNIAGDPYFTEKTELTTKRVNATIDEKGCRLPINFHTPFIDASNVYSYDVNHLQQLRSGERGRLKTSDGDMLPFKPAPHGNEFDCGDHRCMEHAGLTSMHTLWVREHNHWAEVISNVRSGWTDDEVFWKARQIVIAEMQAIIYKEWLPALLGSKANQLTAPTPKYNPSLSPDIHTEFAVAGYRLHTMINNAIQADEGPITLVQLFTQVHQRHKPDSDIGALLKGFVQTPAETVDDKIVSGVRNFLFGSFGLDLFTLNLVRGREVGIARYGEILRCIMGKFGAETSSNLDAIHGLLTEEKEAGCNVGPTLATMIIEQFKRLRDSDPNYYEWETQKSAIGFPLYNTVAKTTMKQILMRNTNLKFSDLPENVFLL